MVAQEVEPVPPLVTESVPVVEARGMMRFRVEVAIFTQLVPLYDNRSPERRELMFKCAPPKEILLPKVWRAVKAFAV